MTAARRPLAEIAEDEFASPREIVVQHRHERAESFRRDVGGGRGGETRGAANIFFHRTGRTPLLNGSKIDYIPNFILEIKSAISLTVEKIDSPNGMRRGKMGDVTGMVVVTSRSEEWMLPESPQQSFLYVNDLLIFAPCDWIVIETKKFLASKFDMKDMGEANCKKDSQLIDEEIWGGLESNGVR
ncbi:hypothetical protein M569_06793 [Genlisea aurea]|uniref:Uncharacterized protein n=1 Tax=Genlisea aurea TaxID=192259 RepID=S8CLF2_9LAMI|nr:hypothetical protein M569_06793 [Genlisea aurea]